MAVKTERTSPEQRTRRRKAPVPVNDEIDMDLALDGENEPQFVFEDEHKGERLFFVAAGRYVQYSGTGDFPPEVEHWMRTHHGETPPFMPLPSHPVEFHVDEEWGGRYVIPWPGHGPLPEPVFDYICENGVLPRNASV